MKMKEILEKQTEQLSHELVEKQKHLFDLRSQAVTEKLEDPSQLGKTKKDIARIKTVLRQRQLEQQGGSKAEAQAAHDKAAAATAATLEKDARAASQPAFGRRTRVNAAKQKVRARKTGGGKTASRKVKARKTQYRHRRKARAANSN
jgi:large subunit ribosomal protein L29